MNPDKSYFPDELFSTALSDFLKGVETEYDAYEGLLYALVLFSSATGGFIDFKGDMDYFDFTAGALRRERHGATSTLKFWDLELPQKGKMIQKNNIILYNSDGTLIGLTEPKNILNIRSITLALMLARGTIAQLAKFTSLKDSHYQDPLTGVHNRLAFDKDISHAILFKERFNKPVFLMNIDLNNFKIVNDKLGHDMGDRVLKSVCHEIQKCTVNSGHLYRVGGDEFCVILKGVTKEQCEKISRQIQEIVYQSPGGIATTCSIGIVEYTDQNVEELLKKADKEMYNMKRRSTDSRPHYPEEPRSVGGDGGNPSAGMSGKKDLCEMCGKPMVVKDGKRGKFLSCSDFPKCKFSKSISNG